MNNNFLWVDFPCLCFNSKLDPSVLDYMQCARSLQLYGVFFSCQTISPSLVWKWIGSSEMLQQHGKQPGDRHEQMSFRFDRKTNSSRVSKHSWVLRENQYLHESKFLGACMITAFKVLCTTGKAMISLCYFGLVFHVRTYSNFKEFELQCDNANPRTVLYKVL